jgi:pimeloyl-ACP methyl ester carboxylesterase
MDLFGHSASGGTCLLYAAAYAYRIEHLVLVSPSLRVVGIPSNLGVEEVLALHAHEPWYDEAVTALYADAATPQELERFRWLAAPLLYGRWDGSSRAQAAAEPAQFAQPATDGFYAGFDPDPALPERLAELAAPVLLVAGEYDIWPTVGSVRELLVRLGNAELALLPRTGHFAWVDDPSSFVAAVEDFLRG